MQMAYARHPTRVTWLALARAAREQGITVTAEDIERNSPLQRRLRPQVIPSLTHA